jgi:hypothetical protein
MALPIKESSPFVALSKIKVNMDEDLIHSLFIWSRCSSVSIETRDQFPAGAVIGSGAHLAPYSTDNAGSEDKAAAAWN